MTGSKEPGRAARRHDGTRRSPRPQPPSRPFPCFPQVFPALVTVFPQPLPAVPLPAAPGHGGSLPGLVPLQPLLPAGRRPLLCHQLRARAVRALPGRRTVPHLCCRVSPLPHPRAGLPYLAVEQGQHSSAHWHHFPSNNSHPTASAAAQWAGGEPLGLPGAPLGQQHPDVAGPLSRLHPRTGPQGHPAGFPYSVVGSFHHPAAAGHGPAR
ncbi:splicing factor 3B subunit 4 isoform X5 [Coturnix japonica]|uniref:splicing factor 3B subunit 4 isoform X5 n=1 Tax=Coturnix japonica TaxID=93934 RepID=UPI0013A5D488|nr:splicing factor 3B subunit 4 isoform X5 [Coturnix japonica]